MRVAGGMLGVAIALGCAGDDEPAAGNVVGTLTLPAAAGVVAAGRPWGVRIGATREAAALDPVAFSDGLTADATMIEYSLSNVPAGEYFVLGFVDVDASGGAGSTPGDFAGWYGHSGDGNPPAAPNARVPEMGPVRFDIALVER